MFLQLQQLGQRLLLFYLRGRLVLIQASLEHLAGLKGQNPSCADLDIVSRLGLRPAGPLSPHHKISEAGDLDLLLFLKAFLDDVKHRLNNLRHFLF